MEFREFREILKNHFNEMTKDAKNVYVVNIDKDELWNLYLDSFPSGTNNIYRTNREFDCSCCRHFIKTIGNVVAIKDNKIETIWNLNLNDGKYQVVADALDEFIRRHDVSDIFVSEFSKVGQEYDYETNEDGSLIKYEHFQIDLPTKFVNQRRSIGDIQGEFRDTRNVFKRSLDEITEDSILTVLELISQNSLYKGEEWQHALTELLKYKKEYDKLDSEDKALYAWEKASSVGMVIGRIRNHSMGTLLTNISEGMELDEAVRKYEQIVAPANYKRPKAIFTKKMLEEAKVKIEELGYMDSLQRRYATLDDITVNNILFSNKDSAKKIPGSMDIFGEMEKDVIISPRKFSKVEEISAQDFVDNVLPLAKEIEVFVENKHEKNFVSLIAPINKDSNNMFKWNNSLSWAYTGNITDSDMKANVKAAGGNVDGVLRFSIQWNESGNDNSDLDAHCKEPNGNEICFSTYKKPRVSMLGGQLDVDITHPERDVAVENIVYADKWKMKTGVYKFFVNQFCNRGSKGFKAEIEFDGEIHSFEYNKEVRGDVQVAEVTLNADGSFTINEKLNGSSAVTSKTIWNVNTNQFVPVSVVCYSPNYFDAQEGIGHRHLMFMLKDCINTESPNGFYNEYLKEELMTHKRVFEALGSKCHVEDSDNQLSGIGFSMTKRADLIVKVKGATERVIKVKF